jgi:hypothetical protein
MTKKEDRLAEAEYFLEKMTKHYADTKALNFNYSAFLNASRSVIQYIFEEVEHKPTKRALYDTFVGKNEVIQFFRDKRNINIHERPVTNDSRSVTIHANCTYVITGQKEQPAKNWKPPTSTVVNKITNWNDVEEEIVEACTNYVDEIKKLLADGRSKGYII